MAAVAAAAATVGADSAAGSPATPTTPELIAPAMPARVQAAMQGLAEDMQELPAGSFLMGNAEANFGDADERPAHPVSVRRFHIARHAITFAQYDTYTDATARPRANDAGWGRESRPVIHVSWNDAQEFVRWLNAHGDLHYRLPTEAEWEYAARAGSKAHFPWGEQYQQGLANGAGIAGADHFEHSAPVGSFPADGWGLYDMIGNVEQWVADCYRESYVAAPADGSAVDEAHCSQRVRRGGSWGLAPFFLRADYRNSADPAMQSDAIGFRLARDD